MQNTKVMYMATENNNESVLNLLSCKCPRCRKGDMFQTRNPFDLKNFMKMRESCPVCSQPFDIEVGFYYGSSYVSYALSIALCVTTFVAWWMFIGISVDDNRVFWWLLCNAVFLLAMQPVLMRLARTGWLAFFVPYDRHWKINPPRRLERTNEAQKNAW